MSIPEQKRAFEEGVTATVARESVVAREVVQEGSMRLEKGADGIVVVIEREEGRDGDGGVRLIDLVLLLPHNTSRHRIGWNTLRFLELELSVKSRTMAAQDYARTVSSRRRGKGETALTPTNTIVLHPKVIMTIPSDTFEGGQERSLRIGIKY